ncbi:hypothetical protein [Lacticaseibacillus zhaodongensis]|uniref:hypothetical protein n=1 Tax=Lacticaseibacillus zhaodongensis TaxID=2668065 RepID=UPI0012D34FF1|nr:hypothetical protein [Lacticaseibacillus zhaodongensis]
MIYLFFNTSWHRPQEMYDVASLPEDEQQDFVSLNSSELKDFRKVQQQSRGRNGKTMATPTDGGDKATTAAGGKSAQSRSSNPWAALSRGRQLPPNISSWLDSNVDPRQQHWMRKHYEDFTPEQQAQMQEWFAARRKRLGQRTASGKRQSKREK